MKRKKTDTGNTRATRRIFETSIKKNTTGTTKWKRVLPRK
jgi:hypothetical protein